ncbi:putative oxidoreductase [Paracoccus alcaliphilus]|uniref:Putative oxidoreductase n=1 Tax=Paracoccus alcaliphilus TaxID=34002 RepID=A0A1H8HSH1_9RHOB|nr:DoxX family protein [Paracoccus alcaliphilus]SEN58668.1 putative oxidoreductase [Paracoccus alcaliphilus]
MSNYDHNNDEARLILPGLQSLYSALSPLVVLYMRVIAGIAFMAHGWPKMATLPTGPVGMVEGLGFPAAGLFAPLLALTEFVGGALLVAGLLTRPVALAQSFVLLVTVYAHWIAWDEGYSGAETSLLWLGLMLYFAVHGAGRFSVDRVIGKQF